MGKKKKKKSTFRLCFQAWVQKAALNFSLLLIHFYLGFRVSRRVNCGIKHSCLSAEPQMKMIFHEKPFILLYFLSSSFSRLTSKCEKNEYVCGASLTLIEDVAICAS